MRIVLFISIIVSTVQIAVADVVQLVNGDKLSGEVRELIDGKLVLKTSYAGDLRIDWTQVVNIETVDPFEVEFVSGAKLNGAISTTPNRTIVVASEAKREVQRSEIVAMRIPPEQGVDAGILDNWHGAADVGYTITRGNSRTTQFAVHILPQRRTSKDLIKADLRSLRSAVDTSAPTSSHSLETRYDRFLSPRLFAFLVGKAENDRRELLTLRTSEGGGFGVRLRPTENIQLSMFGGSSFVQENFQEKPLRYTGEGLLGYEVESRSFNPLLLSSKAQLLPSLTGLARYRLEWDGAVRVPFEGGLNFGVRLFNRFDSRPQPTVKKNDYGLISTIGLTF